MKCNNCGTPIEPGMTTCPYCRMPINVLPETPSAPTLPQDQGLNLNNNSNNQIINNNALETNVQTNLNANQNNTVNNNTLNNNIINQSANLNNNAPIVNNYIPTSTEQINDKLSSFDQAPVIKKEKNKKGLKKFIIIFVILCLFGGLGYYFYTVVYTKGSLRTSNAIDRILNKLSQYTNDDFELGSGEYTLNYSLNYNDSSYKTTITGKYGYDLDNRIVDLTANMKSLSISGEELIEDEPVSIELYMYRNVLNVLFQNFLNKYIYGNLSDVPDAFSVIGDNILIDDTTNIKNNLNKIDFNNMGIILNNISQNDIDYTMIIRSLKQALKSSASSMITKQSIENSSIFNKMLHLTTINLSSQRQASFVKNFYNSLTKNETFISEVVKLTGKTEEQVIDMFTLKDDEFESLNDIKINIFTSLFSEEFVGMDISSINDEILIVPIGNGIRITYKKDNVEVLKLDYTSTTQKTSATEETNRNITYTYYVNKVAYNGELTLQTIGNLNPKVEKVNTKNSVHYKNLSEDNYNSLVNGMNNYGKLGLYLKKHINYNKKTSQCDTATNCVLNTDGTYTCNYCDSVVDSNGDIHQDCTKTIVCQK